MTPTFNIDLQQTIHELGGWHPAYILRMARILISNPEVWTQGALARDANGKEVSPRSSNAVCFCLEGAIIFCSRTGTFLPFFARLLDDEVRRHPVTSEYGYLLQPQMDFRDEDGEEDPYAAVSGPTHCASLFNDTFVHEVVLDLLDRAVATACTLSV